MNATELKYELIRRGIRGDAFSLEIGLPSTDERYCLVQEREHWEIYYAERGQKGSLEVFEDEPSACDRFLQLLSDDPSVFE